jgi:hypothetical protein
MQIPNKNKNTADIPKTPPAENFLPENRRFLKPHTSNPRLYY